MKEFDRGNGIGASEIATVLGLNKYKSPVDLYLQKTCKKCPAEEKSHHALRGQALEPLVGALYTQKTGNKLVMLSSNPPVRSEGNPIFFASPDAMIEKNHLVELKTSVDWNRKKWEERIPDEYYAQVQQQMYVTGAQKVDVTCFFGDESFLNLLAIKAMELSASDLLYWIDMQNEAYGFFFDFMANTIVHTVLRDDAFIDIIEREGERFWNDFALKGKEPPIDGFFSDNALRATIGKKSNKKDLAHLNEVHRGRVMELLSSIKGEKSKVDVAQKALARLELSLLREMEGLEAKAILYNGAPVAKVVERKLPSTIDRKKLKQDYPDAYEDVLAPSKGSAFYLKIQSVPEDSDEWN